MRIGFALVAVLLLSAQDELSLPGLDGKRHALKGEKAAVVVFVGTECPAVNRYLGRINALGRDYAAKGVAVFAVNANALETVESIEKHARGFTVPVLLDRDQKAADALKATLTPTAVVLDAAGKVRYRGSIDDNKAEELAKRRYVRAALDAVLAGREVEVAETRVDGCTIQRAMKESAAEVTYAEHVAPILNKHCVSCHRPGQVAPFSFTSYESARRWARDIKLRTQAKQMPPWKPVNAGVFRGERVMSDAEIALLAKWADGGAPLGDEKKLPPAPKFPEGWALGEPDIILEAPEYDVAAEGEDEYRTFVLDPKLTEDAYVTAVEYRPGNPAVVHHIFATIDEKGIASVKLDEAEPGPGYSTRGTGPGFIPLGDLAGWGPGMQAAPLPEGTGYFLPKGCKIAVECHYHKNGRREKDRTRVGLYLAKKPVAQRVRSQVVINFDFEIPPGAKRHLITAGWTVKEDAHAVAVIPHMHLLGKEIQVTATLPDKSEATLVHIREWDFNWQEAYFFREPFALPKGTKVRLKAWFDNSADNPNNPLNPPKVVGFGEATTDEMAVAYFTYVLDKERK